MVQERLSVAKYSLSFWDFEIPSETDTKVFRPGDRINRENFVPFIIWSFAISRGTPQGQASAIEWIHQHCGFDQIETARNFNLAGGVACLSDRERQFLLQAIKGVRKHEEERILEWNDSELLGKIEKEFLDSLNIGNGAMLVSSQEASKLDWHSFLEQLNDRIDYKLEYDKKKWKF